MDNRLKFLYCLWTELWGRRRRARAGNGKAVERAKDIGDIMVSLNEAVPEQGGLKLLDDYDNNALDASGKTDKEAVIIEVIAFSRVSTISFSVFPAIG